MKYHMLIIYDSGDFERKPLQSLTEGISVLAARKHQVEDAGHHISFGLDGGSRHFVHDEDTNTTWKVTMGPA